MPLLRTFCEGNISNMKTLTQPNDAYEEANQGYGIPVGLGAPFVCPHPECRAFAQHQWGIVNSLSVALPNNSFGSRNADSDDTFVMARCTSCSRESLFVNSTLTWPIQSSAPAPSADFPSNLKTDFDEARMILPQSPRGAAALLRLVIQKLWDLYTCLTQTGERANQAA